MVNPGWPLTMKEVKAQSTDIPALVVYDGNYPPWQKAETKVRDAFAKAEFLEVKGAGKMEFPAYWHARLILYNYVRQLDL